MSDQKNQNQDIYSSAHRSQNWSDRQSTQDYTKPPEGVLGEARKYRITVILLALAVMVAVGVLVWVAARYYLAVSEFTTRSSGVSKNLPSVSFGETSFDPVVDAQVHQVLEMLADLEPSTERVEDDRPLTGYWVKQVALLVASADQARLKGNMEDALRDYREAVRLFPDIQGLHGPMGLCLMAGKEYSGAASAFERALEQDPVNYGVANNLGAALLQIDRLAEAEEALQEALKIKPSYSAAQYNLANLYLKSDRMAESSEQFRAYLEQRPTDINAAHSYAYTLIRLEQWDKAAVVLTQIADMHKLSAPVYFRLAQALSHTDNRPRALSALRQGSDLVDPRTALSWLNRNEFDGLRDEPDFIELVSQLSNSPES